MEIRRAYLRKVRQCHPDVNPALPDAEDKLKRLIQAYEVLSDTASRESYDRIADLFASPRYPEHIRPKVPRTIAERKSRFIKPLIITLALAAAVLFAAFNQEEARLIPYEQTASTDKIETLDGAGFAPKEQWALWYWESELQRDPRSNFAVLNLAISYMELARSAAKRGDTAAAEVYKQRLNWAISKN
ncbi:MAG: J domain-containing protein [Armatimonadetes bacterium]|nr:J domain-containing protein [Armatimonadota bacterium]